MKSKDRFNNVNNNKNIIYINLQKPTVKRRKLKQQEQQQNYNQASDLHPTVYRPIIYDNSSPNMERPVDVKNILKRGVVDSFIKAGNDDEIVDVESNIDQINQKQEEERLAGLSRNITVRKKTKSPDKSPQINFDNIHIQDERTLDTASPLLNVKKPRGRQPTDFSNLSREELVQVLAGNQQKQKIAAEKVKLKKIKELEEKKKRDETPRPTSEQIRAIRQQNLAPFVRSQTATNNFR